MRVTLNYPPPPPPPPPPPALLSGCFSQPLSEAYIRASGNICNIWAIKLLSEQKKYHETDMQPTMRKKEFLKFVQTSLFWVSESECIGGYSFYTCIPCMMADCDIIVIHLMQRTYTTLLCQKFVWFNDIFENNFWIQHKFLKYLKEICWLGSDQHFSPLKNTGKCSGHKGITQ